MQIKSQGGSNHTATINDPGHNLKAGDWVVVKKHVRKSCLEPRWKGLYQVILTTTTAVKCVGIPNWIHASHTKKVTCPTDEEIELSKITATEKEVSGPESNQRGTETEGEPVEDGLVTQTATKIQKGDGEPISTEAPGEPTQREVLPEVDRYRFEVEPLTDPEGEGGETEGSQSVPTPPELLADPSRENTISQEEGIEQQPEKPNSKRTLRGGKWPELPTEKGKVVINETIEEEVDTTRKEDLSEGELQGDRKLKRKRIANRRYAGPEWAYATSAEWQQDFLAFCFVHEVPALFVEMRLVDESEANNATVSETATLTLWDKFEKDTKYLHNEINTKVELSTNVFYRLLTRPQERFLAPSWPLHITYGSRRGVVFQPVEDPHITIDALCTS
ncbi:hypothetical protein NDU88_004795 [Pleurodeles waltl]|uniref:Murine leukemia virus integrase C-terminal domain-containing protein n=1 Tax=Pleurodeles waltl TaxID=8319 RepID=A0AAV7W9Y2_PLEWA|nr:hypothetical protein NDU88_004795 [Pleurodeles waltl]